MNSLLSRIVSFKLAAAVIRTSCRRRMPEIVPIQIRFRTTSEIRCKAQTGRTLCGTDPGLPEGILGLVNHLTGKVALSARVNPKISIFKNLGGHLPIIDFD